MPLVMFLQSSHPGSSKRVIEKGLVPSFSNGLSLKNRQHQSDQAPKFAKPEVPDANAYKGKEGK